MVKIWRNGMVMMKKFILVFGLGFLLTGCVDPTPYAPRSERYGYADQQVDQTHYRVSFIGNNETSRDTVENYLLYRAAQLTLASGNDWFTTTQHDVDKNTSYSGFADPTFGVGVGPAFADGYYGGGTVVDETPSNEYRADLTMVVSRGVKPADNNTYDAHAVLQHLQPLIVVPKR